MPRPTLQELLATPIVGSFAFDEDLLRNLSLTALDKRLSIADRAKAVRQIDVVMGLDEDTRTDANVVKVYEENLVSDIGYEDAQHLIDEANETGEWGAQ